VSDTSQGPGWWQASDGKWYPPEQAPGYQPPAESGGGGGGASVSLDFGAAFNWAWKQFTDNLGAWLTISVVVAVIYLVFFGAALVINSFFVAIVLRLLGYVVGAMIALGFIRASLASTRGEKPELSMMFQTDHLGPYILASILFAILFTVGFVVCCVGEIAVVLFLGFYGFFIVDKDQGATDSLSSSFNLVKDNFGNVLLLLIIAWALYAVGVITCGIVLLATGPLAYLLLAYGFRTLNGETMSCP